MRKACLTLAVAVLSAVNSGIGYCEKIVKDPNTPAAVKQETRTAQRDERLEQRVTYTSGQARLHDVADALTAISGVTVRSGRNGEDWRSRDVPVVVCAQDLPLGKLLRAVVDAAHLNLFSERVGNSEPIIYSYRMYRDAQREKIIEDYFAEKEAGNKAINAWDWDAAVKFKDVPASEFGYDTDDTEYALARAMSEYLAALGPEVRDKVLAGEAVRYGFYNVPGHLRSKLDSVFRASHADSLAERVKSGKELPSGEMDWNRCNIVINTQGGSVMVPVAGPYGSAPLYSLSSVVSYRMSPISAKYGLPKYPKYVDTPPVEDPGIDFKQLKKREDFVNPVLQKKINLKLPEGVISATYADLFSALSNASGVSIVCEDFASHRTDNNAAEYFKGETTVAEVLRELGSSSHIVRYHWFLDESGKLVVGRTQQWPTNHRNLVPESFLVRMQSKLNEDGLHLNDLAEIMCLEDFQFFDWISHNKDLAMPSEWMLPSHRDIYRFYASLSPQNKAQAMSEAGLPLGQFDSALISELFQRIVSQAKRFETEYIFWRPDQKKDPKLNLPVDPVEIGQLTFTVKDRESWIDPVDGEFQLSQIPGRKMVQKHSYDLEIEWPAQSEKPGIVVGRLWYGLPAYSKQRTKEIYPEFFQEAVIRTDTSQ